MFHTVEMFGMHYQQRQRERESERDRERGGIYIDGEIHIVYLSFSICFFSFRICLYCLSHAVGLFVSLCVSPFVLSSHACYLSVFLSVCMSQNLDLSHSRNHNSEQQAMKEVHL